LYQQRETKTKKTKDTMITKEQILEANQTGLNEEYTGYYTPVLRVAYNLGLKGISLQNAETATCFRFGKAPENYLSWNYSENTSENGLSVYTEKSIIRSEFLDRQKYEYTGLVSGKGGDGETLILCFNAQNLD
jgi:hypothetical protein